MRATCGCYFGGSGWTEAAAPQRQVAGGRRRHSDEVGVAWSGRGASEGWGQADLGGRIEQWRGGVAAPRAC